MPRRGRIRMVGKREARDRQASAQELRDLERELRWQWRQRRAQRTAPQPELAEPEAEAEAA